MVPHSAVVMPSNEQWKYNRKLVGITMSPLFLATVAGPRADEATNDLVQLWIEKVRLAGEHVFDVKQDIRMVIVDVMWCATFGSVGHNTHPSRQGDANVLRSKSSQRRIKHPCKTLE